jgi:predicted nuclease with TOPRIM domain
VAQIEEQVKEQKTKLGPDIKRLRNIRSKMTDMETDYNEQKKRYDQIVGQLEMEKERIQEEMGTMFTEYKEAESKFHSNNVQADIFETFQRRIQNEAKFISSGDERLAAEYKSYHEFFQVKVS